MIFHFLSCNPKYQEKLRKELNDHNIQFDFSYNQILNLEYLDAFLKECLRLFPVVTRCSRIASEEIPVSASYVIPKGSYTHINISNVHKNKDFWGEDAEKFKPERFMDGREIHPFAWIPFFAGGRNCIGQRLAIMELKTCLVKLILKFDFSIQDPKPLEFKSSITREVINAPKLLINDIRK